MGVLQSLFRTHGFVGVIAAAFHGGRAAPAWAAAGGHADVDAGVALVPHRRMLAGSITKLLTATVALRLVAEERVRLDDPANHHLSSLILKSDAVTVRHLLTHTGGVSSAFEHFVDTVPPTSQVLGTSVAVEFIPGSQHRYSNGGYAVLGQLVADVRRRPYGEVVAAEVFSPLAMADSAIVRRWPDDAPCGYVLRDGAVVVAERKVPSVPAAGGLYTTAADLGRFLAGWRSLLAPALAAAAVSPQVELGPGRFQGYGWRITDTDGTFVAGHGGGVLGFRSSVLCSLDTGDASVVLANSENDATEQLSRALLAAR